jgi:decaprenylphospho-beta-D-erythro-pentofuranosid-2-ulose 2-reductase
VIDATGRPQSVLVLGGSSEIARAVVATVVPGRCSTVVLAGRPGPRLDQAVAEARAAGAEVAEAVTFDVDDTAHHTVFADQVFDRFGDIDLVIAAAGLLGDQGVDEHDPAAAAAVMTTNYVGLAAALLAVADRLRHQGHGRVVVLSSVAGERARRANFIYGSSKAGLDAFAQGLADSLVGSGVAVTIVRPGFVVGRMTEGMRPAPFATTPEAVAAAVAQGITSGAAVVYVPSVLRWAMVVLRHLPRALWQRVPG